MKESVLIFPCFYTSERILSYLYRKRLSRYHALKGGYLHNVNTTVKTFLRSTKIIRTTVGRPMGFNAILENINNLNISKNACWGSCISYEEIFTHIMWWLRQLSIWEFSYQPKVNKKHTHNPGIAILSMSDIFQAYGKVNIIY